MRQVHGQRALQHRGALPRDKERQPSAPARGEGAQVLSQGDGVCNVGIRQGGEVYEDRGFRSVVRVSQEGIENNGEAVQTDGISAAEGNQGLAWGLGVGERQGALLSRSAWGMPER
jgi:hypothetical protein